MMRLHCEIRQRRLSRTYYLRAAIDSESGWTAETVCKRFKGTHQEAVEKTIRMAESICGEGMGQDTVDRLREMLQVS